MKRFISIFLMLLMVFAFCFSADAATRYFRAEVYRLTNTGDVADSSTRITSGITYKVLATDSDTAETIWSNTAKTSKTNPVTTTVYNTQDRVDFYCDPTDSGDLQVDLIVNDTSGGYTAVLEDFLPTTHKIIIDERPNVQHHGVIWFTGVNGTETDTGIDFDYDTAVEAVRVEIVTVESGSTIDVGLLSTGTNGDADGFNDGISGATAGYVKEAFGTRGALLDDGTDIYMMGHVVLSANEQSLTHTTSGTPDGYLHYFFTRLR